LVRVGERGDHAVLNSVKLSSQAVDQRACCRLTSLGGRVRPQVALQAGRAVDAGVEVTGHLPPVLLGPGPERATEYGLQVHLGHPLGLTLTRDAAQTIG